MASDRPIECSNCNKPPACTHCGKILQSAICDSKGRLVRFQCQECGKIFTAEKEDE